MTLILRPIEDSETITELLGTGADLDSLPRLIWENDRGIQEFLIKQIQYYRSKAAGERDYKFILLPIFSIALLR